MADATDLKSVEEQSSCGFKSHHRYFNFYEKIQTNTGINIVWSYTDSNYSFAGV